jgi:hypothetical protein
LKRADCDRWWWINESYGNPDYLDHPFYYREPNRPWRPAAIATHLYDWPSYRDKVADLARRFDISAEPVSDFPSWWFPGWTTLVLYRRKENNQ